MVSAAGVGVIIGDSGPVWVVSPRVAHHLANVLSRALADAVKRGYRPDPDVIRSIGECQKVADIYAARSGTCGTSDVPPDTAPATICADEGEMDARGAAVVLGVGERAIRGLAGRGSLPGNRGPGGWRFLKVDVEKLAAARGLAEGK